MLCRQTTKVLMRLTNQGDMQTRDCQRMVWTYFLMAWIMTMFHRKVSAPGFRSSCWLKSSWRRNSACGCTVFYCTEHFISHSSSRKDINTLIWFVTQQKKVKEKSAVTSRSPSQTPRGRRNRQNQTSANRSNVRKALRLALSSPSEVIAMLTGLKNTK